MIYLIKCDMNNTCKIGFTTNINSRLAALQTSNPYPLRLIGVLDGDVSTEKNIHKLFSSCRLNGEWFDYTDAIKVYFESENILPPQHGSQFINIPTITIGEPPHFFIDPCTPNIMTWDISPSAKKIYVEFLKNLPINKYGHIVGNAIMNMAVIKRRLKSNLKISDNTYYKGISQLKTADALQMTEDYIYLKGFSVMR